MARVTLSNTGDYELVHGEQDVRGHDVYDESGNKLGEVDAMIVDTDAGRVTEIRLENGTSYQAKDIRIGEDRNVYVGGTRTEDLSGGTVTVYDDGKVVDRERVAYSDEAYAEHSDNFRQHYTTTYGTGSYEEYEPAYKYGYESAHHDDYYNHSFDEVDDKLRNQYGVQHAGRDYDRDRDAIRHGYTSAQRGYRAQNA